MIEFGKSRANRGEREPKTRTSRLSTEQLVRLAEANTSAGSPVVSPHDRQKYIEENVRGVNVRGTNVLFISHEYHDATEVPDVMKSYIDDPRTKVVGMEYFEHELQGHMDKLPVVGKVMGKVWENKKVPVYSNRDRLAFARNLAETCKESDKVIAVADIANRPAFELAFFAQFGIPSGAVIADSLIENNINWGLVGPAIALFANHRAFRHAERHGRVGDITPFEKFSLDVEDARRVYVAAGLQQLADEYKSPKDGKELEASQIVVPYPPRHVDRILHYLTTDTPVDDASRKVKEVVYRALPRLDFSVRQYRWDTTFATLSGDESQADWQRFSNREIPIFN